MVKNEILTTHLLSIFLFTLTGSSSAAEDAVKSAWPPWDGQESVADYARRVNLPPTQTLDLGNGVKMELALIPAGRFVMGAPEPEEPKECLQGQTILGLGGALALGLLIVVLVRAIRGSQRPNFSLRWLLLFVFAMSIGLYGGVRWHQAWLDYHAALAQYDAADADEKPAHQVTLTKPFYIGKFPVTQEQYQQVVGNNPSNFKGKDNPVENVSWDETQAFCKKVTEQVKQTVRLPTEAEWEYACRSGTVTSYYSSNTEADLARVAWYSANSNETTHPVGQRGPNAFGLYDMQGNVSQWCQDRFAFYGKSETENPQGPSTGANRLERGGSWKLSPTFCRPAHRHMNGSNCHFDQLGFRVAVAPAFRLMAP